MKTVYRILCSLLLSTGGLTAQQLSPFVISPSGGFYNNASGMLSFTTGEMSAVETFTSPSAILTQGFQQYWDFGTYITERPALDFSFSIYPNPTAGQFDLFTKSETAQHVVVEIFDLLGQVILRSELDHHRNTSIQFFDLRDAAPGMYVIAMRVTGSHKNSADRFVSKLQVIR